MDSTVGVAGASSKLSRNPAFSWSRSSAFWKASTAGFARSSFTRLLQAIIEAALEVLAIEVAADEDDAALALLIGAPRALMIAVEDHVHALEDEAVVQAGAGIVWDSDPGREWKESLRKAAAVREAFWMTAFVLPGL